MQRKEGRSKNLTLKKANMHPHILMNFSMFHPKVNITPFVCSPTKWLNKLTFENWGGGGGGVNHHLSMSSWNLHNFLKQGFKYQILNLDTKNHKLDTMGY